MNTFLQILACGAMTCVSFAAEPTRKKGVLDRYEELEGAMLNLQQRVTGMENAEVESRTFSGKKEVSKLSNAKVAIVSTRKAEGPLRALIEFKKTVEVGHFSTFSLTIEAEYRDGAWHYVKCEGANDFLAHTFYIKEDAKKIFWVADVVKFLRLRHQDPKHPQPK
jgi:hypothetical protein